MATVTAAHETDAGFSMFEVLLAMSLLAAGLLTLTGMLAFSARQLIASQDQLVAGQRASEAVESVFKARDNRILTWAQIRNITGATGADGGIFQDGPRDVRNPGADGLVNTADDGAVEVVIGPGADGLLGTADDTSTPLFGFTREIEIRNITATLRQLRVIVRFRSATGMTQYVLTTFISSYA